MSGYPVIEQDGECASVTTQREATGRWMAWVHFERSPDYARLKDLATTPRRVPNDYPGEEQAVLAAYAYARELIAKGQTDH
jgi:hypothetical protein